MLLIKILLKYLTVFTIFQFCRTNIVNYFGGQFDEKENCRKEEEATIQKLIIYHGENNTGNCWKTNIKSPSISHLVCFSQLRNEIYKRCNSKTFVKTLGKSLYCQKMGEMNCCYDNFECIDISKGKYIPKQENAVEPGLDEYTKYGFNILPDLWAFKDNFRICKKTSTPMDNKKCAIACQEEDKGDFAIKCRENKNLFKCCITKGEFLCDSCNFCCILPVCSVNGTTPELHEIKFNTNVTLTPEINSSTKAEEIQKFMKKITRINSQPIAVMNFFVQEDFCVKTAGLSNVESFYNMTEYRYASTEKEMKAVSTYAMEEYAMIQIPKTRKLLATKQGAYIWQEIFLFNKCYNVHPSDKGAGYIKCSKKCEKLEQSPFAKQCNTKKNSVFKCCISAFNLDIYEKIQRRFMKKNKKSVKSYCSRGKCMTCCVQSLCTTQNSDKKIVNRMYQDSPYNDEKYYECMAVSKDGTVYSLNMTQFKFAYTKDALCNVEPIKPVKISISKSCEKKRRAESKRNKSKRKRKYKHKNSKKYDYKNSRLRKRKHKRSKKHDSKKSRGKRGRYGRKKKRKGKGKKNYRTKYMGTINNTHTNDKLLQINI